MLLINKFYINKQSECFVCHVFKLAMALLSWQHQLNYSIHSITLTVERMYVVLLIVLIYFYNHYLYFKKTTAGKI